MALKNPFLIIDGSYYLFRTFFGSDLNYSFAGVPNNAVMTSMRTLRRVLELIGPTHVAVVFDSGEPTFRHELSSAYKAHRPSPPEELRMQIPYLKAAFSNLGIRVVEKAGFEGDDLIGTIATQAQDEGFFVIISTGDKDMFQLVDQAILVENSFADARFSREDVKRKLGVYPEQVVDYLALVGDSADGVAGVRGIGARTAANLLEDYGDIDAIIEDLPNMRGAAARAIASSLEGLALDRILTRIKTDVDIGLSIDDYRVKPIDQEGIDAMQADLGYIYGYRLLDVVERLVN